METIERPQSMAAVLPDELVAEVLSFLAVKSLMRFRCVNKSFNTLISDPHFVQMHLKNSARNPHLAVMSQDDNSVDYGVLTLPMSLLLKNSSTTVQYDPYFGLNEDYRSWWVIGSCNGLLCLFDRYYESTMDRSASRLLSLWNPATRTQSEFVLASSHRYDEFSFGYDKLNETYKVVAYHLTEGEHGIPITEMKVFSMRDNYLINIQCFPAVAPVSLLFFSRNCGVYLSGTVNWLVIRDLYSYSRITNDQYVILSLNLSTETYTQLLLPRGFDKVPDYRPRLVVLMDCLCFCHDFQNTHFVIWKMKDFGVKESWIQLYKVGYENLFSTLVENNNLFSSLKFKVYGLLPLYLSKSGDTLIWTYDKEKAFIYNGKKNRVERIGITNTILWLHAKDYVESLASTR